MIKKSIGFSWGPSAVGTTMWTGRLYLLSKCMRSFPLYEKDDVDALHHGGE